MVHSFDMKTIKFDKTPGAMSWKGIGDFSGKEYTIIFTQPKVATGYIRCYTIYAVGEIIGDYETDLGAAKKIAYAHEAAYYRRPTATRKIPRRRSQNSE